MIFRHLFSMHFTSVVASPLSSSDERMQKYLGHRSSKDLRVFFITAPLMREGVSFYSLFKLTLD